MPHILTPRLALIPTPLSVLKTRLVCDSFVSEVDVAGDTLTVTFPPEWPGLATVLLPIYIAAMETDVETVWWGGTIINRDARIAVGMTGCKGFPDATGTVEIGYGINEADWGRGYATEIVAAFVAWLTARADVSRITAETLPDGFASQRVLQKCGFTHTGTREDADDGTVWTWARPG